MKRTVLLCFLVAVLAACPSGPNPGPGPTPGPTSITVTGRVTDEQGRPVAGARPAAILGKGWLFTNANGVFTATDVAVPYDLVTSGYYRKNVYRGLSRSSLSFVVRPPEPGAEFQQADLGGAVTGYTPGDYSGGLVVVGSPEHPNLRGTMHPSGPNYSVPFIPFYKAQNTITTTVRMLTHAGDTWRPIGDYRYGERVGVTLTAGQRTVQDLDLAPVPTGRLSGRIEPPAGYTASTSPLVILDFNGEGQALLIWRTDLNGALDFDYPTPVIPGARLHFTSAWAYGPAAGLRAVRFNLPLDSPGLRLVLPDTPLATLEPGDNEQSVTHGTVFRWTPARQAVHAVAFVAPPGKEDIYVHTADASTTIPDLSSLGLPLLADTSYRWSVSTSSVSPRTTDDIFNVPQGTSTPAQDRVEAMTHTRYFRTAP